ncbi:hypothetical protein Poly24_19650 [Rosistilla carotiformis]|uniref:DUF218 domain-containing protein n=1 Tax=Rosistilla carotiformis TaxID=2528017 RepID=A0A518JRV7_9BACT|nr:YdcF family protein [Rosistilla carotiformis]QDV68256.1 hypothetical protein Poly24_19650 [Rosistilla carotiformis]
MVRRVGLLLLLLIGLLWASHAYLLREFANVLDATDPHFPADYVVVLPGGPETRTFAAVVILREGLAAKTAILRNPDSSAVDEGLSLPTHVVTQRILQKRGIADDRMLFLDGESRTTYSDLQLIDSIFDNEPEATIAIVTNRFHTRRARWAAANLYGDKLDQFCFVGTPSDAFLWDTWWESPQGLEMILAEYLKLVYYIVKYSTTMQRVTAVAIVLAAIVMVVLLLMRRRRYVLTPQSQAADLA